MDDRPLLSATDPEQIERFRAAVKAQRERREEASRSLAVVEAPAVHDDRSHKGYCPSLDITWEGRSHRKRVLKERGLECVG